MTEAVVSQNDFYTTLINDDYGSANTDKLAINDETYDEGSAYSEKPQGDNENMGKVLYLGCCFLMLYTAYTGAQTLVSEIYEQLKYDSLGQLNQLALYAVYFCSALVAPGLVKSWKYKTGIFIGTLGFLFTLLAGTLTTACQDIPSLFWCQSRTYIYVLNIVCSMINGFAGPILWLCANSYIGTCASEANKGKYMGIFSGFVFAAGVIGSLIGASVIKLFGQSAFYKVCLGFCVLASLMVLIAPDVEKDGESSSTESTSEKAKKMLRLAMSKRMLPIIPYLFLMGVQLAFYNVFEFKIVLATTPGMAEKDQNSITATMYCVEGVTTIIASLGAGKLADVMKTQTVLTITNVSAALAVACSFAGYYTSELYYAYLMAIFLGLGYAGAWTLASAIMAKDFDGSMEAYAVVQFVSNMATSFGCLLCILIKSVPGFLSIVAAFLVFAQVSLKFYKQK